MAGRLGRVIVASVAILTVACGGGDDDGGDDGATAGEEATPTASASGPGGGGDVAFLTSLADATCESFITVAELEAITGNPVNEVIPTHYPPEDGKPGVLGCLYAHRDIVELHVAFSIGDRANFYDRYLGVIGTTTEPVDGLGDEAYLQGPTGDQSLRVAVGGVALHLRHNDPTDPDSFLFSLPHGRAIAETIVGRIRDQL